MFLVTFQFEDEPDVFVSAEAGENLLQVAKRAGAPINAPCSGYGSCGKCLVRVVAGELDSSQPFTINDIDYSDGWRLACISRVKQDVTVWVKEL